MGYKELISTYNNGDIAIIKSILDSENINYHIQGENFNSIYPLIEPVKFMVPMEQIEPAKELIKDLNINIFSVSTKIKTDQIDKTIGWKIYFWFIAFLMLVAKIRGTLSGLNVYGYIDFVISLSGLIGLYAFSYEKRILTQSAWKFVFIILIAWNIWTGLLYGRGIGIYTLVTYIFLLPLFVGLFIYSFKNHIIWNNKNS